MHKSFFIITTLLTSLSTLGMENLQNDQILSLDRLLEHDAGKLIFPQLSTEDYAHMRLVCKKYAAKDINWNTKPHWTFMPDNIEKEYDRYIENRKPLKASKKTLILLTFTAKNDLASVQWIKNNTNTLNTYSCATVSFTKNDDNSDDKYSTTEKSICVHAVMFAIHNKNPKIARFLIETDKENYPNNNWEEYYNTITAPEDFPTYFDSTDQYDFSILPYLLAIWTKNVDDLRQLCSQKIPNIQGQEQLIIQLTPQQKEDHKDENPCDDFLCDDERFATALQSTADFALSNCIIQ